MMGNKLILAPMPEGKKRAVSGAVAWLRFGTGKLKVLLQDEPDYVLHYATGMRISPSTRNQIKVHNMVTYGPAHRTTDRQAAQRMLDDLVNAYGIEKISAVMAATPVINED